MCGNGGLCEVLIVNNYRQLCRLIEQSLPSCHKLGGISLTMWVISDFHPAKQCFQRKFGVQRSMENLGLAP